MKMGTRWEKIILKHSKIKKIFKRQRGKYWEERRNQSWAKWNTLLEHAGKSERRKEKDNQLTAVSWETGEWEYGEQGNGIESGIILLEQ